MATTMRWVSVSTEWTLVTSEVAMLQFSKPCTMFLGGDVAPTTNFGFMMTSSEKFVNNAATKVWVRDDDLYADTIVTVCEVTA